MFLQEFFPSSSVEGKHVHLWSDGPTNQFKNRYMFKFASFLQKKYKLASISWNFFATAHGKGAVDGIGGSVKRTVWREVKSRRQNQVKSAKQFIEVLHATNSSVEILEISNVKERYTLLSEHANLLESDKVIFSFIEIIT